MPGLPTLQCAALLPGPASLLPGARAAGTQAHWFKCMPLNDRRTTGCNIPSPSMHGTTKQACSPADHKAMCSHSMTQPVTGNYRQARVLQPFHKSSLMAPPALCMPSSPHHHFRPVNLSSSQGHSCHGPSNGSTPSAAIGNGPRLMSLHMSLCSMSLCKMSLL